MSLPLAANEINPEKVRPRLALVGNAPVKYDLSTQIDACDLVIRCNEAKNLGPFTGSRTDILCVCNSGAPAERFITLKSLKKEPKFPGMSEIWFSRPGRYCARVANEIIEANLLFDLKHRFFSEEVNDTACNHLRKYIDSEKLCPSTGFLAFWYILNQKEFDHYDKYLFGFTFDVWAGHPAVAEMKVIESSCRLRQDLIFIPAESFWKVKRLLKLPRLLNYFGKIRKSIHGRLRSLSVRL